MMGQTAAKPPAFCDYAGWQFSFLVSCPWRLEVRRSLLQATGRPHLGRHSFDEAGRVSRLVIWVAQAVERVINADMGIELIEQKLAEFERRLSAVESRSIALPKPLQANPAWRELIGWSKDDHLLREAARLGAEWREQMNREGK